MKHLFTLLAGLLLAGGCTLLPREPQSAAVQTAAAQNEPSPPPTESPLLQAPLSLSTVELAPQALDLYLRLQAINPGDAPVEFDLYRAFGALKEWEATETHLDAAVQFDPGYGHEYVNLALLPTHNGRPSNNLDYLEKALAIWPSNPFLKMEKLNSLLPRSQRQPAEILLRELSSEDWSTVYYPEIQAVLEEAKKTLGRSFPHE